VSVFGYTGTLRANSQGSGGQAGKEDAASVSGYTGTLRANSQVWSDPARPSSTSARQVVLAAPRVHAEVEYDVA